MRSHPKAWTLGLVGLTLIVALGLFFSPQFRDRSVAAPRPAPAPSAHNAPTQYAPIAPADVLGTATPWAPATGDGSN